MSGPVLNPEDWLGREVRDSEGHKVGTVEDLYFEDAAGRPGWALVKTGLFGSQRSFIPAARMWAQDEKLHVPFTKGKVTDAPRVEHDQELSEGEERLLYSYYGLDYPGAETEPESVPRPCDLVRLTNKMRDQPLGFMVVAKEEIACDEETPAED